MPDKLQEFVWLVNRRRYCTYHIDQDIALRAFLGWITLLSEGYSLVVTRRLSPMLPHL